MDSGYDVPNKTDPLNHEMLRNPGPLGVGQEVALPAPAASSGKLLIYTII